MHPDDARWQALLDGEQSPSARAELERHLAGCAACRRSLAELQYAKDELTARLELVKSQPPPLSAQAIRRRARPRRLQRLLAAASILLAFATAAGATIHSGVLHRMLGGAAGAERITTRSTQRVPGAQTPGSGITLAPRGALEVRFDGRQKEGTIRIVVGDRPGVSIVASAIVPYTVERGRVTVSNQGASASYTIMLSRTLSRVTVVVGDETVFRRQGGSIVTAATADSAGGYVIPLATGPNFSQPGER